MKLLISSVVLFALVLPVFSQDTGAQRYKSLSDTMGTTVSSSNDKLKDFDQRMVYNGNGKVYASYKQRYDSLYRSLQESEIRMNRLIQSHDYSDSLKQERGRYENLLRRLESVKSEYDNWLNSVQ